MKFFKNTELFFCGSFEDYVKLIETGTKSKSESKSETDTISMNNETSKKSSIIKTQQLKRKNQLDVLQNDDKETSKKFKNENVKLFCCPRCLKPFTCKICLKRHLKRVHVDGEFECQYCTKAFETESHRNYHMRYMH